MKFKNNTYLYGLKIRKEIKLNFNSDISTSIFPLSSFLDLYSSIYDLSKIKNVLINGNNHLMTLETFYNHDWLGNKNILISVFDSNISFSMNDYVLYSLYFLNCYTQSSTIRIMNNLSLSNCTFYDTFFHFTGNTQLIFENSDFINCVFLRAKSEYTSHLSGYYPTLYPTCNFKNCTWQDD